MSLPIFPFKCEDSQLKAGVSCEKQKEIYDNIYKLQTGELKLQPFPVGLGLNDPLGLNYEQESKTLSEKLSKEAQEKAVENISEIQSGLNKKDYLIYGIGLVLLVGIVIYEFKRKKL
jgi:hypothetical protein